MVFAPRRPEAVALLAKPSKYIQTSTHQQSTGDENHHRTAPCGSAGLRINSVDAVLDLLKGETLCAMSAEPAGEARDGGSDLQLLNDGVHARSGRGFKCEHRLRTLLGSAFVNVSGSFSIALRPYHTYSAASDDRSLSKVL